MKNIISIFFLSLIFVGYTQAQLGIKAGLIASNLVLEDMQIEDRNAQVGLSAGLMYRAELTDWFSVQPEVLYSMKGSSYRISTTEFEANLGYLDVPVLVMFHPLGDIVNVYVGPQMSYLLSVDYTFTDTITGSDLNLNVDRDNYNDLDIGLVAGVGVTLKGLMLDLRVARGYIDIDDDRSLSSIEFRDNVQNVSITASVGLLF